MQLTVQNQTFNGSAITARSGKITGHRFALGIGPISTLRKQLRETGLSANETSAKIAQMIKDGQGDLADVQMQAALVMARSKGMMPTSFEIRDKSFCLRGSAIPSTKAVKAAPAISEADKAKLDLLKDLTPEQVKAALEMLK